jgi:hypothetical protein
MIWPQLVYEYLVGGLFFALTLWLCFRPGGSERRNPSDRRTLVALLSGLGGYFILYLGWILLATR